MPVTKTVQIRIGKTRILHILDTDPDLSYLGEYTNDIGPGVIIREHGEFYERIKTEMERDYDGRFIGKLPPEYSQYYNGNEYPGFKPSNMTGAIPNTKEFYECGLSAYHRMESINRGDVWYIGIRVETTIETSDNDFKGWLMNKISSGGLWGIESDSGADYLKEIEGEEKGELKQILLAMGLPEGEIEESFRNAELKEEW